jgi:hypothetical protein
MNVNALFAKAQTEGRVGTARKCTVIDARPAVAGEVVVTLIEGEGKETQSRPAKSGDWVVRNRSQATGNERYLVSADTFAERYEGPLEAPDPDGWQSYRPRGVAMQFLIIREEDGALTFTAPWGEEMTARPGDALVRNPANPDDTYRVAADAFAGTYEVLEPPNSER